MAAGEQEARNGRGEPSADSGPAWLFPGTLGCALVPFLILAFERFWG